MSESTPPNSASPSPGAETPPEDQAKHADSQSQPTDQPDDLPEEYELTPELVEEEAIRGDFVLRWAAVLLAVLLGCTHIASSEALVHVKTGQYLAAHGMLPDGTDPFAYTTEGRTWRNQAWLFDLILAGVYGIGGAIGLSLFKGLIAGVTIWCVVGISRPNTPTWWTAIVAVSGSVALIPHIKATPEIVTILGCAVLLRLFTNWRFQQPPTLNWKLAVLFLIWCNTDPRMYLGLLLLLLLTIGETLRRTPREDAPIIPREPLWPTFGVVCLVSLMNPFGWHSWLSAWHVHGVLDPAMRTYFEINSQLENLTSFPVWTTLFWDQLTVPFVCGLVVAGLAISAIYLNFGKWILGDILAVLVFGGLAACTFREFGPAIIVMCIVTSLYCQDWYRESFSQEYTVNQGELLFSRGGRALTVLSFVAVAWLGISGRLYHRYLTSIGFGLESNLNVSVADLESYLADSYDKKPFNFTIAQGDTLIWANQRVFIDSRLGLFTGTTDSIDDLPKTDLIALHSRTRESLRYTDDQEKNNENRSIWTSSFDRFEMTHALPRIAGRNPDYLTYNLLLINPEFQINLLAPSVAVFYRNDLDREDYRTYLAGHGLNFVDQAFGEDVTEEQEKATERVLFPQPESAYVSYLTADREQLPPTYVLAQHYSQHIEQAALGSYQIDFRTQLAFCYMAIRNANLALAENPNSSEVFHLLGRVYFYLGLIEQQFAENTGVPYDASLRWMQAHLALNQALVGDPDNVQVTERLFRISQLRGRPETMLRTARRFVELLQNSDVEIENQQEVITQTQTMIEQLQAQYDTMFENVSAGLENGANPLLIASELNRIGCPHTALEIMNQYSQSIPQGFEPELLRGVLELEAGEEEDAYNTLLKLEPVYSEYGRVDGYRYATYAALGHADYSTAFDFKQSETDIQFGLRAAERLMTAMPLSVDPERYTLTRYENWSVWVGPAHDELAENLWMQAVFMMEAGRNSKAAELLDLALELAPNSSFRPMLILHHSCVSDEKLDPTPPAEHIPITSDMFAEDPAEPNE